MSVKKSLSFNQYNRKKATTLATVKKVLSFNNVSTMDKSSSSSERSMKKKKKNKTLSLSFSREIKIEPAGVNSLKEVDSNKLKADIIRWAKAVAAYARQISGRFGG